MANSEQSQIKAPTEGLPQPQGPMADQTLARYVNERRILTLLRVQGPMSRAEAARQLGLTRATITHLVESLGARNLVAELRSKRQKSQRREQGRPGVAIALNPEGGYFLGAEIGVGVMRFALLDFALNVVDTVTISVPTKISPVAAIETVVRQAKSLEQRKKYRGRLRSLGMTVPGLVRSDGFVVHLPILGWKDVNLQGLAESELHLPTAVENNANAAAFGEAYLQPSRSQDSTVYLKLGIGCGGAAIVNGRLLRGASGTAGEFGHLRVAASGPRCSCGQEGCLESCVNLAALAKVYRPEPSAAADGLSLPMRVASKAAEGDPAAQAAIDSIADYLTIGLVSLTNIFNPRTVVLGGVMRPVLASCLEVLRGRVSAGIVPGMQVPEIRLSTLGEMECAIGAATITHHRACDISSMEIADIA
jgi:N-acetylglucosamine repressor